MGTPRRWGLHSFFPSEHHSHLTWLAWKPLYSLPAGESMGETAAVWKVSMRQEDFGGDSPLEAAPL